MVPAGNRTARQKREKPTMTNPEQERAISNRPPKVDEQWFTRIQRAKTAREQGRKAREGKTPVNPLSRGPLSVKRD